MNQPLHDASVSAYLVDLDGTLYRPLLVKLGMALELVLTGPHMMGSLRAFRHEHERMREDETQDYRPSPFKVQIQRAADRLRIPPDELEVRVRRWMIERPGKWIRLAKNRSLLAEIATFRGAGGRTALVSDYPARAKLIALGASSLFDVTVASGESEGLTRLKPSPAGYLLAAERLGVPPERCLVIGDRRDADGRAAERAGMRFRCVR